MTEILPNLITAKTNIKEEALLNTAIELGDHFRRRKEEYDGIIIGKDLHKSFCNYLIKIKEKKASKEEEDKLKEIVKNGYLFVSGMMIKDGEFSPFRIGEDGSIKLIGRDKWQQ